MRNGDTHTYQAIITSPVPDVPFIGISIIENKPATIDFLRSQDDVAVFVQPEAAAVVELLQSYLYENRPMNRLPTSALGTPFQQRVWQALQQIPFGEVRSYGEVAKALDSSARAVANACKANPLPLLVPCHRVVAANGPGGYMGATDGVPLAIKRWLLQHEGHD